MGICLITEKHFVDKTSNVMPMPDEEILNSENVVFNLLRGI